MADYSVNVRAAKMARLLALAHILVGILLIVFGIADRVVEYYYHLYCFWTSEGYFGIWIGLWMCITGGLGIPGSARNRTGFRNCFNGVFMGFSIISAVFGGIIIICYSVSIAACRERKDYYSKPFWYQRLPYDAEMAISAIILVLGIAAFVIGIWAPICCCLMKPCACCACCDAATDQQAQQVVNVSSSTGYIMPQPPGGAPVAVPVQAGGAVAMQPFSAQEDQPTLVMMPGAYGGQHMMVPSASSAAMPATVSAPQEQKNPPTYA